MPDLSALWTLMQMTFTVLHVHMHTLHERFRL